MKRIYIVCISIVMLAGSCLLAGCATTVNDAVKGPFSTVGTVLAVPQSVTQGINSGYTQQTGTTETNPYGR